MSYSPMASRNAAGVSLRHPAYISFAPSKSRMRGLQDALLFINKNNSITDDNPSAMLFRQLIG